MRAEGFVPHAAKVTAALSAAATTTPKTGKRAHVAWARTFEGRVKPIPSYSSGGSAREGASLQRSPLPRICYLPRNFFFLDADGGGQLFAALAALVFDFKTLSKVAGANAVDQIENQTGYQHDEDR